MDYDVNFRALAVLVAVMAITATGYLFLSSDGSSQQSFDIDVEGDATPGELTRITVSQRKEPVQGANISINGEFIGTTNSQGIKGLETPENNFTVQASKGGTSGEATFTVTEEGGFESSVDDQEASNSENDDNGFFGGGSNDEDENSDTLTGEDSEDGSEQDSQDDTTEITDDYTGLELSQDPAVGELVTVAVYEDGETQSGVEVTVDGESVGTTNSAGTVNFAVPDTTKITVSTDSGLEEALNVEGYTQDDQQQEDDNQTEEGDTTTGIQLDSDPVSGTTNRIILYDNGDRVSGETVYLDGEELGQTGTNGAIEFEVPLKDQITVSTDYNLEDQTFDVQQNHPEPEIILNSPNSGETFETLVGEKTVIDFEASVEITESSGTASLILNGSEIHSQSLTQGANTFSATQGLNAENYDWEIAVDTEEFNTNSAERSLTVSEREARNGLELNGGATAGEYSTVSLYDNDEPVQGEEIFVNSDSVGTTDEFGELKFQVPNTQDLKITTETGLDELTKSVENYEPGNSYSFESNGPFIKGYDYNLVVLQDGSVFEGVDVFVNGVNQGSTDSNGEITFEVPVSDQLNVRINTDEGEYEETFDTSYVNFEIINPENEGVAQDYGSDSSQIEINTDFEIDTDLDGSYHIYLDGKEKLEESITAGSHEFSEKVITSEEGNSNLYIEYETSSGKTVRSFTSNFEVEWLETPFIFELDSPINQESIDDYEVEVNFGAITSLERDYDIGVRLNGELISSDENLNSNYTDRTVFATVDQGTHNWYIEVNDSGKDGTLTSEIEDFETTVEMPVANATNSAPGDGASLENNEVAVDIRSYESLDYTLVIDGSDYETKSLDGGEEGIYTFDVSGLSSGDYNWHVEIESTDSSKTFETDQWSFTVN